MKKSTKAKPLKRKTKRASAPKATRHEIVVKVQGEPTIKPADLAAETGKGKNKYSITPTWMQENQIVRMLQRTPAEHVHKRAGRGGSEFEYVTGTYVKKVLNYVFGWNWDFEIVKEEVHGNQIVVRGRLTVRGAKGQQITKEQYGGAEIKKLKTGGTMDIGNDFKAAATDALKKCASELGFASDIYGKNEFKDLGRPVDENGDTPRIEAPKNGVKCEGYKGKGCPGNVILTHAQADYSRKIHKLILCSTCQHSLKNK